MKYVLLYEIPAKRNELDTLFHMEVNINSENPIYKIKYPSPLTFLNKFKIVDGFVPDSMHVFIGIGKQFCIIKNT